MFLEGYDVGVWKVASDGIDVDHSQLRLPHPFRVPANLELRTYNGIMDVLVMCFFYGNIAMSKELLFPVRKCPQMLLCYGTQSLRAIICLK